MRALSSIALAIIAPFIGWDAAIYWHDLVFSYTGHGVYAELMTFFAIIAMLATFVVAQCRLWKPELHRFLNPT